jgi:hypothetical protein
LNFSELFKRIKPRISWFDNEGFWYCGGCGRYMDKPEMELHYPFNCSLSKLPSNRKVRQIVVNDNFKLYQKYGKSKGVKILPTVEPKSKSIPLSWYKKQIENYHNLPMNMSEPSGVHVQEAEPIPLRKLTSEDLIPKICMKSITKRGDQSIDSIPMRDQPFRDLDNNITDCNSEDLELHKVNRRIYYTPQNVQNMKDTIIKAEWEKQRKEWLDKWEPKVKKQRGT